MQIVLRPYQEEALQALDNHIQTKNNNPLVVIPTGGGKSILMAKAIENWKAQYQNFRVMILAHRQELVEQNYAEYMGLNSFSDVGIFAAGLKRRDTDNDIIFASIDSVYNKWNIFPKFDCLIVDEAHRINVKNEGKYRSFIENCKYINPKLVVIGFTATPFRLSSGMIAHRDHLLNEVCYDANVADLIRDGYLCKLRTKIGDVQPDLSDVRKARGDYVVKDLSKAIDTPEVVRDAVKSALTICNAEQRKSVIIFCIDIKHCEDVSNEIRKYGYEAPVVTSKTTKHERKRIINEFANGGYRFLCSVNVFLEGFNVKRIDCVLLLRPTQSKGLYIQAVGRGLRLFEGKEDCLILDYANVINEHGPIDILDDDDIAMIECANCGDVFSRAVRVCPNCKWEIPKQEIERHEAEERAKKMHEAELTNRSILSGEPDDYTVSDITVHRHKKNGKPDSIRIQYRCGLNVFREWIALDHGGYAERKARLFWSTLFGDEEAKTITVDNALNNMFLAQQLTDKIEGITVIRNGKYNEVISHKLRKEK